MNLEKRFIEISEFLKSHSQLTDQEALDHYPNLPVKYIDWIKEIRELNTSERIELENDLAADLIKNESYRTFLARIKELISIEKSEIPVFEFDKKLRTKISLKKQHEISVIDHYLKTKRFSRIIDIGSGAGHLSTNLISKNQKTAKCIDASSEFQKIGIDKLKKIAPEILARMTFEKMEVNESSKININIDDMLIGLHACGDLSVHLIKSFCSNHNGQLLNYGCCYHKLSPKNYNLSNVAKKSQIKLNTFSLTLSAKGHRPQTPKDLTKKLRVKTFRYALHMLNKSKLQRDFTSVGNGLKSDYEKRFLEYVEKFSPESLEQISKAEIEDFFESEAVRSMIENLLILGIIRSQLARLVELYIVLDRALWLEENGAKVELKETFDQALSPRNISLYASYL